MITPDPEIIKKFQKYNLQYELIQHDPFFTCAESSEFWVSRSTQDQSKTTSNAKSLLLRNKNKTQYYLLVVNCNLKVDIKTLQTQLDSTKLSFASPSDLTELLQVYPGCVNPFSLIHDQQRKVDFYIQSEILNHSHQAFHPGNNHFSVEMPTKDFFSYFQEVGISIRTINL